MKKILILTPGLREEEDLAVSHLREAVAYLAPGGAAVEKADLLGTTSKWLPELLRPSGKGEERVHALLQDWCPDVVVSTCPDSLSKLAEWAGKDGRRDFVLVSLLLDSSRKEAVRGPLTGDFHMVLTERAKDLLVDAGVRESTIRVFGYPVAMRGERRLLRKEAVRPDLSAGGRPRVLYLVNSARRKAFRLIDRLLEHPGWDVTVALEKEDRLLEMAREKEEMSGGRLQVVEGFSELPLLLERHHVAIGRPRPWVVQESIAAGCPLIGYRARTRRDEENLASLKEAHAGTSAEKPGEVMEWLERAFRDEGRLWKLWKTNLEPFDPSEGVLGLAQFLLDQAAAETSPPNLRTLPQPVRKRRLPKQLLLCDLHTHTTWSDGKLSVPELVDFYGQRGFDCLAITDHLCDPERLLGRLVNLTGLVIPPDGVEAYFEEIEREKKRAWAKYDLLLMTGIEFNKDGYTPKTSTHLLGVDLKQPIDASLGIRELIAAIHAQDGLAVASHPHEVKSPWGRNTLYLWEHLDEYAPLIDAWEVANRDDIFNPVGLKKLPFIANSDFHKPKHIHSWKTVLHCEKEAEAIKQCIRVNRDVSLTLYRDHRFGLGERREEGAEENAGSRLA